MTATTDPFVKLPVEVLDLVAAGKLTIQAGWLYALMLSHINYKRGDGKVWPSRRSLAQRMRFKNPRAVDRYVAELVKAGLIECDRRRHDDVNDTNMYTLLLVCAREGVVSASALPSAPQSTRGSAQESTGVVRDRAPELDEPQLDQRELDQPSLSAEPVDDVAVNPSSVPKQRERDASFKDQKFASQKHRILAKYGWFDSQADHLIKVLEERHEPYGVGWWITADKNGTLPERIQEVVDERLASGPFSGPAPVNGCAPGWGG